MSLSIDVEGVPVRVPDAWKNYSSDKKAALCRMVQNLKNRHGDRLLTVHVDRSVPKGKGWRFDGGYSTR